MKSLQNKIDEIENNIKILTEKLAELEKISTETGSSSGKYTTSEITPTQTKGAADISTGLMPILGGKVLWNSAEIEIPPAGTATPVRLLTSSDKGFNRHSHSKFSGGALDINTLELAEYKRDTNPAYILDKDGNIANPDCQSYWKKDGEIVKVDKENSGTENKEGIEKIGKVNWVFDPQSSTWGCSAYEIDVSKCYLVWRDTKGNIMLDTNGKEMKSKLLIQTLGKNTLRDDTNTEYSDSEANTLKDYDNVKTAIIWDDKALVWRFYSCYAEDNTDEGKQEPPPEN